MKKAVSVILLIAVVALGAMHGHYTFLRSNGYIAKDVGFFDYLAGDYKRITPVVADAEGAPKKPVGDSGQRARRPLDRRPEGPAETPTPGVEETKPPREVIDISQVADLVKIGRELYGKSEYESAKKRFDEAVSMLEKAARQSSPYYREAGNYARRCRVFNALVGNIPFLELSDGRGLSRIELESGRTIVARIVKDDGDNVTIQQNDGIQATISYDQIDTTTPIKPGEYRSQLIGEYKSRLEKADPKAYFDVFGVALFAIQNKLREEITPILEKTFMLPGSELVLQTFYTGEDADELIVALLESFDKTKEAEDYRQRVTLAQNPPEPVSPPEPYVPDEPEEPGADPGPFADPDPGPPAEPVAQPAQPVGPPGSKSARTEEAGRYFAAGQRFANYATRNVSKRNFYGKKAFEELGKARDILNVLQDQYPGDMEIENLLQQVSDLLQFVVHNLVGTQ